MQRIAFIVLALAVGGAAIVIAATAGGLPDRVASSFGAGGRAHGWMSRETYLALMLGLTVGVPALLAVSIGWLPRVSIRMVNLPNRDHWLAPERREVTLAMLAMFASALGAVTAIFVAAVHLFVVAANAASPPRLPEREFALLMAGFGVAMVGAIVTLLLRFRRPR